MADTSRVDPAVLLANLRGFEAMLKEDIPELEALVAAQGRAEAMVTRYHAAAMRLPVDSVSAAASVPAPPAHPPAHPPRRKSPPLRLDPKVERLSDEVRAALAEEIGGRAPLDALGHVVGRVGEIQAADAYYVLVAADLVNKKPSSGKSHVHKLLSASGRFVNVGGGRSRLRAEVAATEDASGDVRGE